MRISRPADGPHAGGAGRETADPTCLSAVAAVLMSHAFVARVSDLSSLCPSDAWHDAATGRHIVVFNAPGGRGHERLVAFTVGGADEVEVAELEVQATSDGWQATNLPHAGRSARG
jgi:hypothetical protein